MECGAFQLLLPKLLINEEQYSPELTKSFSNFSRYVIAEGQRQQLEVPAAHSASNYGVDIGAFTRVSAYEGKARSPALVSTNHTDITDPVKRKHWDIVFTPHAAIIAATSNPAEMAPLLAKTERLRSGQNLVYRTGFGFMDGYHLKGEYTGQVVPVQLSLDQGMIALAIEQIRSPEGFGTTGRLLHKNEKVRARLEEFYDLLDKKISHSN